jgi:ribokinase
MKIFEANKFEILLIQLEIPMRTVEFATKFATENGIKVILNPAPVKQIPDNLFKNIWLITPNVSETENLTGIKITDLISAEKASEVLLEKGVKNIVISMGAKGAFIKSENFTGLIPAVKVRVVDITAVGDVFNGALAVALSEGNDFKKAVLFANNAASISATRMGAQASAPYRKEISTLHSFHFNKSFTHSSFLEQSSID